MRQLNPPNLTRCFILIFAFFATIAPPDVMAQEDTTPPQLVEFSFSPTTIDVSSGDQTVIVRLRITDSLAGFENGGVYFRSPSGGQFRGDGFYAFHRVSGDALDGIYEVPLTFPQFSEGGTWPLAYVYMTDGVTNSISLDQAAVTALGFPTELVITVNRPPVANAGADQTVECTGSSGTSVTLDGSGSTDPDLDPLTFEWHDAADNVVGTSASVNLTLPVGSHTFTLIVDDGNGGTDADAVVITVRDTTAPSLSFTLSPNLLQPPNHKLVQITANISVSDICDSSPTVTLVSITSNEPDSGLGREDIPNDIQGASLGTDDRSFFLRAERSNTGSGRVYTITYRATDDSGHQRTATGQVRVPLNRRR